MLSMKIDGTLVELSPDFSVTMNLKSPIFNEAGSYSYPFRIPNTPRNAILMGFRHRVANTGYVYHEFKGAYFWKGISIFTGTVNMKVLNSSSFEGYLMEGNGDFNYQRKNGTLQDVDYGQMVFDTEDEKMQYINDCANTIYPNRDLAFPEVQNLSYFDEVPTEPALQYFNYYFQSRIFKGDGDNRFVIVPMLYLRYVLNKIFEHLGFTFDDSFFTSDVDYNSLVLYNSVDCNGGVDGFFGYDDLKILLNYHVPRMSMSDFLGGLESFFNIRFFVNNDNMIVRLISVDKIVKSTECIEFSSQLISISTEPEDKVTGFRLKMQMDTEDASYKIRKPQHDSLLKFIKPSVQSISELNPWPSATIFDTRFVYDKDQYYILSSAKVWEPIGEMYWSWNLSFEWVFKNDDQSISTEFSSLMSETVHPYNAIIGNKRENWKDVTPKLFFIRYQEDDPLNKKVAGRCFVAPHVLVTNGLFYAGETGLLNKHYKAYFDFRISAKLVKIVKQMEYLELKNFDFSKKYMIGGIKYLVKSIQVVLRKDRIMPAILECYTCS